MKRSMKAVAVSVLAAGAVAGGVVFATNAVGQSPTPPIGEAPAIEAGPPPGINALGQTFGDGGRVESLEALPDLVGAVATNGKFGFIKKEDFLGTPPASPDDVLKLPSTTVDGQKVFKSEQRTVPVYASDGVTVIGEFRKG